MAKKRSLSKHRRNLPGLPFAFVNHTHLPDYPPSVADIAERDALAADQRYEGVIIYVQSDQTTYQLRGGTSNAFWTTLVTATGVSSHTELGDIGTNTHVQIDTHIADATLHFTEASISITESQISDLQTYSLTSHNHDAAYLAIAGVAVSADALESATTSIDVSAATAPSVGQVLTATGASAADWQTPAAAGSGDIVQTGSPNDTFVGYFTADKNLSGDSGLTWITSAVRLNLAGPSPVLRLQDADTVAANMTAKLEFFDSTILIAEIGFISGAAGSLALKTTVGGIILDTDGSATVVVTGDGNIAIGGYIDGYAGTPADGDFLTWVTANTRAEFVTPTIISATGTPVDNQIPVFDSVNSVDGDPNFTWDQVLFTADGLTFNNANDQMVIGGGDLSSPGISIDGSVTSTPFINLKQAGTTRGIFRFSDTADRIEISSTADEITLRPGNVDTLVITQALSTFVSAVTVQGALIVTGPLTTLGIDDNASKEILQIQDTGLSLGDGTSAETATLQMRTITDGAMIFAGGPANDGGGVTLYGSTHASNPGDTRFRSGTTTWQLWDESAGTLTISTGAGGKTDAIIINNIQHVEFTDQVRIVNANARLRWKQSDGGTDQKDWQFQAVSETFKGRILDDALANFETWLNIERSGTGASIQIDSIVFATGQSITALTISSSQTITIPGALIQGTGGDTAATKALFKNAVLSDNNANVDGPNFDVQTTNKSITEYAYKVTRGGSPVAGFFIDGDMEAQDGDFTGDITVTGTVDGVDVAGHAADGTIHFTEASIDHTAISNIGTNSHSVIDTHIDSSGQIHFTQGAINIPLSQISDVTATATELNLLDLAGLTVGWVLSADSATTASWKAQTGGGGDVTKVDTPVNNQVAVWTGDGTIEGTTGLTFSDANTLLELAGAIVRFDLNETDAGLDQKVWRNVANTEAYTHRIMDDAKVNAYIWQTVTRSGTGASVQVDTIDFTAVTDITLNAPLLSVPAGNVRAALNTNADAQFQMTNLNTGTAARANVRLISDSAQLDMYATSAAYSGVSGWGDSGIISTSSGTSGGLKLNAQVGGVALQHAQSTKLITTSAGIDITGEIDSIGGINRLRSATTAIEIAAATAPSTNQVLTATSSTTATWQTPASGGNVNNSGVPVINQLALWTNSTTIKGTVGITYDAASLAVVGDLKLSQQAAATNPGASQGKFWVKDTTITTPMFTDDNNDSYQLQYVEGGNVTKVSNPVNDEIGIWTGDGTLEGDFNFTWDGSLFDLNGDMDITGDILMAEQSVANDPTTGHGRWWVRADNPNTPMFTDDTDNDRVLTTGEAALVTAHVRAGNVQIIDGSVSENSRVVSTDIIENSMKTYGPTGSNADVIWDAMDNLPANATILIARILITLSNADTGSAVMQVYATEGNSTAGQNTSNRICMVGIDNDVAISGTDQREFEVLIPLASDNLDFRIEWGATGDDTAIVAIFYKGFMTD